MPRLWPIVGRISSTAVGGWPSTRDCRSRGGMISVVVEVRLPAGRYVAKWAPAASRTALKAGAQTARLVAEHGLATGLPPLTRGRLHTDPAPEAFRLDGETGRVGLIDWTGATPGTVAVRRRLGRHVPRWALRRKHLPQHLSRRGTDTHRRLRDHLLSVPPARHDLTGIAHPARIGGTARRPHRGERARPDRDRPANRELSIFYRPRR